MPNEVWIYTEILPLTVPNTGARASSPFCRVSCVILERICLERSAERALNLVITGALWDMFGSLRSSASCESDLISI